MSNVRKWELGHGVVSFYESGVGHRPLTHMSSLPPLQDKPQPMSRASSQKFLLHGSTTSGYVTASNPATGYVFRESFSNPDGWRSAVTSLALHENIIAFGNLSGGVSIIDVNNRRKLDGGYKVMQGRHAWQVTALLIPAPFEIKGYSALEGGTVSLISASVGDICLHDLKTGQALGMYIIPTDLPSIPTYMITYLDFDPESKAVLVGTCSGDVWIMNSAMEMELIRVSGTEYDKDTWETPQNVTASAPNGRQCFAVDVFFLSDFKNDSVFVIRETSIRRYGLSTPSLAEFNSPDSATFTCATIDPEQHDQTKPRFMAVGDVNGKVYVYNARTAGDSPISPLYTIPVVTDIKITALAINSLVIITGSNDGTARAYSILAGSPLRTLCAPNSRRRRDRPPPPNDNPLQNPIVAISLSPKIKSEVRGVLAFEHGHIRSWNFALNGMGIVRSRRKRTGNRASAKEIKGFVDDEIERDVEEGIEDARKRKRWEKMNGGIEEEDVAIQVALMMSREEEQRRQDFQTEIPDDVAEEADVDLGVWEPGRKVSFGSTSGNVLPSVRGGEGERRLQDVAVFRKGKLPEGRKFDNDLEFAIQLSLAEQESGETSLPSDT